jgi:hypothetical protein
MSYLYFKLNSASFCGAYIFRSRLFQIIIAPRVTSPYEIITGRANTPHLRCKKTGFIFFT